VRGRLVLPRRAWPGPQPLTNTQVTLEIIPPTIDGARHDNFAHGTLPRFYNSHSEKLATFL
jgi:hypothetical protein